MTDIEKKYDFLYKAFMKIETTWFGETGHKDSVSIRFFIKDCLDIIKSYDLKSPEENEKLIEMLLKR